MALINGPKNANGLEQGGWIATKKPAIYVNNWERGPYMVLTWLFILFRGMELHAVCDILLSKKNIVQWKGDVSQLFRQTTGKPQYF